MTPRPNKASRRGPAPKNISLGLRVVLPVLIVIALVMTGFRINNVFDTLEKGSIFQTTSLPTPNEAQAAPALAAEEGKTEQQAPPPALATETPASNTEDDDEGAPPRAPASGAERDIMSNLAARRQEIDNRAKALDTRETLLRVAEQRVDQKVKEMETLRNQVQALINQASGTQQAQIENLVKIYETMKPKEAAKIFDTLDMPILLGVVQKMKPQRTAVIMAEMSSEKAKEVTVALTKQDQLPQLK